MMTEKKLIYLLMKLHNYQQRAIDFCHNKRSVILSIGMGLGKTAAMIHYIEKIKPKKCLIVAPKRVAETVWKQECENWGLTELGKRFAIAAGNKAKRKKIIEQSDYLIIGRDNLQDVEQMSFDLVILDELTSFKNHESLRSKAVYSIKSNHTIGLTGTFLTKGAIDCFGQFCAVGLSGQLSQKERNKMFYRWRATHFVDKLSGSGLQFQNWQLVTPMEKLLEKVKGNIFTLSSEDWLDIPQVEYIEHYIDLTTAEMDEYLRLNTMLNVQLDGETIAFDENQKFAKLQTLCNGFVYGDDGEAFRSEHSTKLDAVVEFIERAAGEGEQVLLFYAFKEEKAWIEEKLKAAHIKFCDVKDRRFMDKWNDGEINVLLAHPASAGHGLNLQNGGRICVWSTITYDLELWLQANARLARQGQKRGVQIHSFMALNTCEKKKYISLNQKEKSLTEFVNLTK